MGNQQHTSPKGVVESQTTGLATQCKNKIFRHASRSSDLVSNLRTTPCANVDQEREGEVSFVWIWSGAVEGIREKERERELRRNLWSPSKHNFTKSVGLYRLLCIRQLVVTRKSTLSWSNRITTQYIIFSVTYYLALHNAIIVYHASHFLLTMVELVVWTL